MCLVNHVQLEESGFRSKFLFLDGINEQEQQWLLVKWLNSQLKQLFMKWCGEVAFCIVVDAVRGGTG